MTTAADETTPLIRDGSGAGSGAQPGTSQGERHPWLSRIFHVENRILFAGFLITLSFSFTQVAYVDD